MRRAHHRRRARGPWGAGMCILALLLAASCADADVGRAGGDHAGMDVEVTIPAAGLELSGTLRLPDGPAPFVGVVIAPGSGPQSRRGLSPGQLGLTLPQQVPVYEELAAGLRDAGYAVLTFDKRTCGPFNGCADNEYPTPPQGLTFDDLVGDVAAVVEHLEGRDDMDEIVLIGHSKGGTMAAQLAAEGADLTALVLLASPAAPIHEVVAAQASTFADLVRAAGQEGTPAADEGVAELRAMAQEVAAVAAGEVSGDPIGGAPRAFWASWIAASRAAPDQIRDAPLPVLALGGERDWNVPPEQMRAWTAYLGDDDRLEILPGITHALTRLDSDDPAAITPGDVGTDVEAIVIDTIADWLDAVTG